MECPKGWQYNVDVSHTDVREHHMIHPQCHMTSYYPHHTGTCVNVELCVLASENKRSILDLLE